MHLRNFLLLACLSFGSAQAEPISIFAASSLKDALDEIYQGEDVSLTYGGSGQLARQLEFGAQADLFISANSRWADYVNERLNALADAHILSNALVLIGHDEEVIEKLQNQQNQPEALAKSFEDLFMHRVFALPNPDFVPAGQYAYEAMQNLGVDQNALSHNIPTQNVRAALRLVELGEADFAIIYQSDIAFISNEFAVFTLPQNWYSPIAYDAVLLNERGQSAFDALKAHDEIFLKYGFVIYGE